MGVVQKTNLVVDTVCALGNGEKVQDSLIGSNRISYYFGSTPFSMQTLS